MIAQGPGLEIAIPTAEMIRHNFIRISAFGISTSIAFGCAMIMLYVFWTRFVSGFEGIMVRFLDSTGADCRFDYQGNPKMGTCKIEVVDKSIGP